LRSDHVPQLVQKTEQSHAATNTRCARRESRCQTPAALRLQDSLENFRSGKVEVDIVARQKDWLVFVEVKTRETEQFGAPSEAVDRDKQRNLSKAALDYLRMLGNPRIHFRFDIVEVIIADGSKRPDDIRLIQNAFDLSQPFIY
jgi:putative endonuclease